MRCNRFWVIRLDRHRASEGERTNHRFIKFEVSIGPDDHAPTLLQSGIACLDPFLISEDSVSRLND